MVPVEAIKLMVSYNRAWDESVRKVPSNSLYSSAFVQSRLIGSAH